MSGLIYYKRRALGPTSLASTSTACGPSTSFTNAAACVRGGEQAST